MAADAMTQ